jgi:hypothetical protein
MEGGEPRILENAEGARTTPSIVASQKQVSDLSDSCKATSCHQSKKYDLPDQAIHRSQFR